jgi:hypothetical protein
MKPTAGLNSLTLAISAGLCLGAASAYAAGPSPIVIDDQNVFPESLTATAAGDLIIGSSSKGAIYRAKTGAATAAVWIDPKVSGMSALLGVYADEPSHTLYACSAALGAPPDKADSLSALRTFDLSTGAAKAAYPMPGGAKALCNDIATAKDGTAYVSETLGGQVLRLKRGSSALEVWIKDPRLAGVDGIAIGGDGAVYVNTVTTGHMFRIPVAADGSAGMITQLMPTAPLAGPDGLRSLGGMRFLQAENRAGNIEVVTVSGDQATITPIKTGEAGLTSAAVVKGEVWAINAKFAYRSDPALKGKDPNPFTVEPVGTLPK